MRKRLLRSRSGFEKPESREEAIMQNILGASNVLEPSESNIEEILKSILYNTPYTKEAEFEIEKILLAIKNNGTYDGECESRDLKILFAILNDLDYTEEAESRIEELFIEWLNQRSNVKVLEGIPPLTFVAKGEPLKNYEISGNTVQSGTPTPDSPIIPQGTGERTGNLFNVNRQASNTWTIDDKYYIDGAVGDSKSSIRPDTVDVSISNSGDLTVTARSYYGAGFVVEVTPNTTYTISFTTDTVVPSSKSIATITYVNADVDLLNYITIYGGTTLVTFTTPNTAYYILITFRYINDTLKYSDIMLNSGSTALPYEPYGYKIPITCGGVTTDIYIGDSPLYDGDTISMTDTGIEIPTAYGNNVLTVDTTVQPSNVYIEYK